MAVPRVGSDSLSGGYSHLDAAVRAGAAAVVLQAGEAPAELPVVRVSDARRSLAELASRFYDTPSRGLHLYAVTGTDGKTTTTYLLEQIFAAADRRTGIIGTVETKIAAERRANMDRMTTPESLDLQCLLREMVDAGVTHVAMEASSHALALDRLRCCEFDACAITNITADHIEFHGSWDEYFRAKASLFTDYGRECPAVLNADDAHFERLTALLPRPPFRYGMSPSADLRALNLRQDPDGTDVELRLDTDRVHARVPIPGVFNVSNALAAVGLALQAGLSLSQAAAGLSTAQPPPGRMQRIDVGQPFRVLVDYAHTTHAFRSVLSGIYGQPGRTGRIIAVFGAAGNRDRAKRPILARLALEFTDFFYITNEDPFGESAEAIMAEVASGAGSDERGRRFELEPDRGTAIRRAIERAQPGDTVIITGKGHEQSIVADGRKRPWSDADAVRAALGMPA